MLTRNLASIVAATALTLGVGKSVSGQAQKDNGSDPYVVILTESDSSPESLLQSYPEVTSAWDEVALYNLLRPGRFHLCSLKSIKAIQFERLTRGVIPTRYWDFPSGSLKPFGRALLTALIP